MRIAVVSDTHGARRYMDDMLEALPEVDALCFLGDMEKDADYLDWGLRERQPGAAFYAVAGNNDPFSQQEKTSIHVFGGVRAMLTHGHLFAGIRLSRRALAAKAAQLDVRLVLYGHTHRQQSEEIDGVTLANPGALMDGSWLLLQIENGQISTAPQRL